jgi:DNA-binding NtrC family response regulator
VSRTILLLEDDHALCNVVSEILQEAGHRGICAATAPEALSAARASLEPLDLVIADIGIPGASGADVASEIKALHPAAGVLYISGDIDGQLGQDAARVEGARFLQKPFGHEALLREVALILSGAGAAG